MVAAGASAARKIEPLENALQESPARSSPRPNVSGIAWRYPKCRVRLQCALRFPATIVPVPASAPPCIPLICLTKMWRERKTIGALALGVRSHGLMVRTVRPKGRKHHGTSSSRMRHDNARRSSNNTAIAGFDRGVEPEARHQSVSLSNMISIRLRRFSQRSSCLTAFLRYYRPGMQARFLLSFNAARYQSPLSLGPMALQ